jgi:hypothetical protein
MADYGDNERLRMVYAPRVFSAEIWKNYSRGWFREIFKTIMISRQASNAPARETPAQKAGARRKGVFRRVQTKTDQQWAGYFYSYTIWRRHAHAA